jgi:hypothetical protein
LTALGKASGYTIVCEDFSTSRVSPPAYIASIARDTTIGEALKQLENCWFAIDEDQRVIIGWARNWRMHHINLIPDDLITDLSTKMNGPGATLDDVAPLFALTLGQHSEWISTNPSFSQLRLMQDKLLWALYNSLSADQKAQAKSDAGVQLLGLDADQLREQFRRLRRYQSSTGEILMMANDADQSLIDQQRLKRQVAADPALLREVCLKVRPLPGITVVNYATSGQPAGAGGNQSGKSPLAAGPPGLPMSLPSGAMRLSGKQYELVLEFPKDLGMEALHVRWPGGVFPMYTPARQAEINSGQAK